MRRFMAAFSLSDKDEGDGVKSRDEIGSSHGTRWGRVAGQDRVESWDKMRIGDDGQDIDGQIKAAERSGGFRWQRGEEKMGISRMGCVFFILLVVQP